MNKPARLLATKITLSADGIDLYKGLVKICICTEGDFKLAASSRADKQELLLREPVRRGFEFLNLQKLTTNIKVRRCCDEIFKLGLLALSVLAFSQDSRSCSLSTYTK